MPTNFQILKQAILEKKQVIGSYDGFPCEMCPHVVGLKRGIPNVLSFQFAGGSKTELPPGGEWKCMRVDGLLNLSLRDGPWHTRDDHSEPQRCVDEIEIEVAY
jgi:hypothetical protein